MQAVANAPAKGRVLVQIRVPAELHELAKKAAAESHRSISNWFLQLLCDTFGKPKKKA